MTHTNGMVLSLDHLNGVHPRKRLPRTHQPRCGCRNRSDTLQPPYARSDFNMSGMEDQIDSFKGPDHLGWWFRTHGGNVGV